MKVIGLGPARSGTDSLRSALKTLGFGPTYHMKEILFEESGLSTYNDADLWLKLALAEDETEKNKLIATILEPWNSGVDWPMSAFPEQLLKVYPDAKFILTMRSSAEAWYNSLTGSICKIEANNWSVSIVRKIPLFPFTRMKRVNIMMGAVVRSQLEGDNFVHMCDPAKMEATMKWYDDWNARVQRIVPKDQLLVFKTGEDGYEQLASYLGVAVPEKPYPSVNSTREVKFALVQIRLVALLVVAVWLFFLVTLVRGIHRLMNERDTVPRKVIKDN
uniref:Sulfotransferase domain-containing protein n=1 Tax=Ditylum brightwellii TaxID=49249 RepID=A0A7S1Z1M9_9STRA